MPRNPKVFIGDSFGRWTVVDTAPPDEWGYTMWLCQCECGTTKPVSQSELLRGHSRSCGCLRKELAAERHTVHGGWKDRLYEIWHSMKKRCDPKNKTKYPHYAGKGITVCKEWETSYDAFKQWALTNGYDKDASAFICTLDRINPEGNYCPENCRWATAKQQANNRTNTIFLTLNQKTRSLSEWSTEKKIPISVLDKRYRAGWSDEEILAKPVRKYHRKDELYGLKKNSQGC